jgi:hypothetical protein
MWCKHFTCVLLGVFLIGCGSSGNGNNGGGGSSFTPVNIQGQYEARVISSSNPSDVSLIEVNFTQTGTSVSASTANVVLADGTLSDNVITINALGGECDGGSLGQDSIEGTFTSATEATVNLSEAGNGTASANVTFSSDGTQITSGSYSVPAQCGYSADSGSVTGTQIQPFSGTYAGMLENSSGGQDPYVVTVSQNGLNLNVTGTASGVQFTLTGSVIGATFNVSGTIAGEQEQAVGIWDHINNDFLVFGVQSDGSIEYVGTLNVGSNPQAISKTPTPGMLKAARALVRR